MDPGTPHSPTRKKRCSHRTATPRPLAAKIGGSAVALGHDPVVPSPLRGSVLGLDARQAHQVVRGERHALRPPRGLFRLHAGRQEGAGRQGGCVVLRSLRIRQRVSVTHGVDGDHGTVRCSGMGATPSVAPLLGLRNGAFMFSVTFSATKRKTGQGVCQGGSRAVSL